MTEERTPRCPSERAFEAEIWPVRCDLFSGHAVAHTARKGRFLWTNPPASTSASERTKP